MSAPHCVPLARLAFVGLLTAILISACAERPTLGPAPRPDASPASLPTATPDLLRLPAAFRYEVTLRPAGAHDEPATVITGAYRDGALAQVAHLGDATAEELAVAPDPTDGVLRSYTRAAGEISWLRWPGVGFDAVFGLASPFSALRLYPLADERTFGEEEWLPNAPVATVKAQVLVSAETVERLLEAGAAAVASDQEQRRALELQLAPLLTPQTLNCWVSRDGRVYQAAATLLTAGTDGQPTPWLELTWRYWDYDDPAIAVVTPTDFVDVGALSQQAPAAAEMPLAADTSLRIRVFAHPGRPAAEAVVTVYPANKRQALAAWQTADAQFALPAGAYDVQVWAEGAEMWLHGVLVVAETATSHDVLFDFGALSLTVTQGESRPQVDIVIYPAGQRQTWLAWRTENPTTVRLPAGLYDVEIALPDHSATRRVEGIQVQGSETVEVTVALGE